MPVKERGVRLGRLALVMMILPLLPGWFFAIVSARKYAQAGGNPRLVAHPELRGRLLDRTGRPLAHSVGRKRVYPLGAAAAPFLGYWDPRLGTAGAEDMFDLHLTDRRRAPDLVEGAGLASLGRVPGPDVFLSLDSDLQKLCHRLLEGRRGAVMLLHVPTGEVLAAASRPSYDPAQLGNAWDDLRVDSRAPLFHRGVSGLYSPGSTFKVLTMIAALEEGVITSTSSLVCSGGIPFDNFVLRDSSDGTHGLLTPKQALAHSCNVAFAGIGLELGVTRLNRWMQQVGLLEGAREVPGAVAGLPAELDGRKLSTAQAAIGQGSFLVTPLAMARLAAVVARGGFDIAPHLYRGERRGGKVSKDAPPGQKRKVMKDSTARVVAEAMRAVVEEGTGGAAAIPGLAVAGKTGTAENPRGRPDAWFIGYAPAGSPKFAVAVMLENAGYGGDHAAPIARQVLQAALATRLGQQ